MRPASYRRARPRTSTVWKYLYRCACDPALKLVTRQPKSRPERESTHEGVGPFPPRNRWLESCSLPSRESTANLSSSGERRQPLHLIGVRIDDDAQLLPALRNGEITQLVKGNAEHLYGGGRWGATMFCMNSLG